MPQQAKPHPMQNQKNILCFNEKYSAGGILFQTLILTITSLAFVSCTETVWQNSGDSCIKLSEKPPLRRVINYTDHDLCGRKLPSRIPPNPQTRSKNDND